MDFGLGSVLITCWHMTRRVPYPSPGDLLERSRRPMASHLSGKVQTVLGTIDPSAMGVTITHEHLVIEMDRN